MRKTLISLAALLLAASASAQLTVYVGRGEAFAQPAIDRFSEDTGISVGVRYGSTAELAVLITEEGEASPADLFWAQDAGALGALDREGLLAPVPAETVAQVLPNLVHPELTWVAVSARSRVLAYSSTRVEASELPGSVFDLTDERYRGRVAWAPGNASFQSFITAMRTSHGEEAARAWLEGMIANDAQAYSNNRAQLDAIAAGEVDFGLVNNYYLPPRLVEDPDYPVAQTFFGNGDIGNLANVTGIGLLESSDNRDEALEFISYLLSAEAQNYFTDNYEYPITTGVTPNAQLASEAEFDLATPDVDLRSIFDLPGTLRLLSEVGLL